MPAAADAAPAGAAGPSITVDTRNVMLEPGSKQTVEAVISAGPFRF
jgi:hypothetical protein